MRHAMRLVQRARQDETEDGNPLTAAWCYITAMEHLTICAKSHAQSLADRKQKEFFLFQVHTSLEAYYKRAELLLEVARNTGLKDKANAIDDAIPDACIVENNHFDEGPTVVPQYDYSDSKTTTCALVNAGVDNHSNHFHDTGKTNKNDTSPVHHTYNNYTSPSAGMTYSDVPQSSVMGIPMCDPAQKFANIRDDLGKGEML